jgi:hypothetical protein
MPKFFEMKEGKPLKPWLPWIEKDSRADLRNVMEAG